MNLKYTLKDFIKFQSFLKFLEGRYKHSNWSFLFSLKNKDNLAPFIANIKQGREQNAIYCNSGYGPTFGGGHDLYISDNPQVNQSSYSNCCYTYNVKASNYLAGQYNFKTTEIEVFN